MADTILSGNLTVHYFDENRRKQIRWTGGTLKSNYEKMKDIYVASEDLFTGPTQQDDGLIFDASTPAEYIVGKITAGDNEPWFIDLETMEHIIGDFQNFTGCALKTQGWTRVQDSNTGIVVVAVANAGNTIVKGDIGNDITHGTDSDAGTLLDVVVPGGATDYLFVRPDSNAAANNFDSTSGTLNCNGNSATQSAAAITGEMVWGNFYTKGALTTDTHVFVIQNGAKVTAHDQTDQDWWEDGQVDRPIALTDYTQSGFPVIDSGFLTVEARKYGSIYTYDVIAMNTATGGQIAAALSSGDDTNNNTGYASITLSGGSGNWNVGDEISGDTSGARAIITLVTGSNPTPTLHYYLVGDPLTNFNGSEAITNEDDTGAATGSGAVTNQGPALSTWFDNNAAPTYTFANNAIDINDNGTTEPYAVTVDVNQATLLEMYEHMKYVTRRGSTVDLDGLDGEQYIGLDFRVAYTGSVTGTVGEGSTVTGVTSGATAVVVSHDTTKKRVGLRNTRGTFVDGEQIQVDGSNFIPASGTTVTAITPVAACPFGTLAGGNFFGAEGVVLTDYRLADENSFTARDLNGVNNQRPTSITLTVSNLKQYDWVSAWRLISAGGEINKTEYSATGGEIAGDATITVDGSIAADVPNKDNGGRLMLRDADDNNQEYIWRFSSMVLSSGVVTLANTVGTAEAGGNGTDSGRITDTGVFTAANVQVGDLIWNSTRSAYTYVTERVSDNEVLVSPAIAGQTTGDSFEINAVPNITINTADDVFFPLMHQFMESDGSNSTSMQYISPIEARIVVRNTSSATQKIKGFAVDIQISASGGSAIATRIPNTVY